MKIENYKLKICSNKGFTLIELLLYLTISGMIIMSVAGFLFLILESKEKNRAILEVEEQGVQVMQIVTQTIRNSEGINSPSQGVSASSVSLDVFNAADDPTVFDVSGGTFRIKEGASSYVSLTNSRVTVSDLSFHNLSRTGTYGVVKVKFTISHVNPEGRNDLDYSKTFYGNASLRQ
ncbi:MAG: prepilin-type N-terminal cleavage/methylation domain-containing protein [Candidatus Moranbacteria bacterium]|nr:prepilin-type N-terminal cleavage/methylation domain-containing protein [Candidatus Moranbacteria bacterium]